MWGVNIATFVTDIGLRAARERVGEKEEEERDKLSAGTKCTYGAHLDSMWHCVACGCVCGCLNAEC